MENKTITQLNTKPWYRSLKILNGVYVFVCYLTAISSIIAVGMISYDESKLNIFIATILMILFIIWAIFWAWIISKVPKWIFYYIYFGSIKPDK